MSKKKAFAFTDSRVAAVQNRRKSHASGTHATGQNRERDRSAATRAHIARSFRDN